MRLKKTIAVLAVACSVTTAGVASAAAASASTPGARTAAAASTAQPNTPSWHVYSTYSTFVDCEAEGDVLLIGGIFGGPFIAYKCVANAPVNPYYWTLWVETPF